MEMIKVFNDHTGEILGKTFVDPADADDFEFILDFLEARYERFTNSEWFKDEDEAKSFIANDLANDPLVRGATFTTHKTIVFKRGE